ncbi:MAG: rRNA maturation RNase YbeY [SAR86 cluster bacterium]|uniref:Endoribonuclease YbeY n=1 Tax=SAR86 cluster bacterium TaxID=2030880 RepID=A0A838YH22_9GAMM|nr:rRNA maturation RNase YbeY [SAR86 cluster bacterium]
MCLITKSILIDEGQEDSMVNLKITDTDEITHLNHTYRAKNKSTNVLSFINDDVSKDITNNLGDIAICYEYVEKEAKDEGKNLNDHLIHMLVHGLYHILGYDHENNEGASVMEAKEINKLKELNIKNPYL